ncbi:hypothetical protein G647_09346 [Cladophialophora carrionii CBS 160.54]|uniref:DUF974 domain-containing protein n=1 Tax=Cladophialophora carrionii CBS 160.54 TaxID=1279043 RepID=V9D0M1_9EURO|nr:uncharacterized protein G647_09346 [Cladophialophora carrionii CBS 160.54]ETI19512.1 hypothetical protein G647_09346 [Cladophialophora carrionii CBS 160.54]
MARARADTGNFAKEPHSVSLKVLRLSRPSLAQQHPFPRENETKIPHTASLAYPAETVDQEFVLSSSLGLPPSFGSAHVGETFSCALCANNELRPEQTLKTVSGTRILAEMQTPSQAVPLELHAAEGIADEDRPGSALQRIIRFDLKEEGNHVLAVNVSYTETTGDGQATSGRVRSFRKLYQFLAQPCLSVRTKTTELETAEVVDKTYGPYGKTALLRYVLEAQLENVSDAGVVLEETRLQSRPPFKSTSLNWDAEEGIEDGGERPLFKPRDVIQVAFLVEQQEGVSDGLEDVKNSLRRDGRAVLGQLAIQWRTTMGERGSLSTGNLLTRRRAA